MITKEFLDSLEYSWTADIEFPNGRVTKIWWTAWPMRRALTKSVISVSSDYPKQKLCDKFLIK